jgi:trimethylamine--corrinoid protein Co-methyltransferase
MKLNTLKVLEDEEIELIHEATLNLLENTGVRVESKKAREFLNSHGTNSDEKSQIVFFPRDLILEQLKHVPSSFSIYGKDISFKREISTQNTHFGTIGTPVLIHDPEGEEKVRSTVLADTIKQISIVDALDNLVGSHVDVWPNDVPYLELHYHVIKAWAENSSKSYGLGCYGRTPSEDMMQLVSFVVGGTEKLKNYPRLIGFFNTTSPLMLPQIMTNGMEVFTKYKQPLIVAPCAIGGETAPVTLAGLLTQSNMEILSGICLSQLYNPGAPVFFGSVSSPMDPHSGNVSWGAIETGLITAGIAQLARYYDIPSRGPGCVTDSKCFDIQNGFERYMTLMFAVQSGINYITCAGTYESSLTEALELLVIDNDLIGMVLRGIGGIGVDENTIASDVITSIAKTNTDYLKERHTLKNFRKEIYRSKIADKVKRSAWVKEGAKDIFEKAGNVVERILEMHVVKPLESDIDKQFKDYLKIIQGRTYEDYQKLEGMEDTAGDAPSPIR